MLRTLQAGPRRAWCCLCAALVPRRAAYSKGLQLKHQRPNRRDRPTAQLALAASLLSFVLGCSAESPQLAAATDAATFAATRSDASGLSSSTASDIAAGGAARDGAARDSEVDAGVRAVTALDAGSPPALDAGVDGQLGHDAGPSARPCAVDIADSGVPGVRIHIEGERCNFAYQQSGTFRYRMELERAIPYHVELGTSCGACRPYSSDATALTHVTVWGSSGDEQISYCSDCDLGCCPPDREGDHLLSMQSVEGTVNWPARAWRGPSDTTSGLGAWFPKGSYLVMVQLFLPGGDFASGSMPITIE